MIFALTFAARLLWLEPTFPRIKPNGISAVPFAAIFALGFALLLTLAHTNRDRLRAVLRPSRGRIIGAVVLALLTPIAVFSWVPWVLGGWVVFAAFLVFEERSMEPFLAAIALITAAAGLWYPAAALIISGLHSLILRVAAFALMFWTAYSAIILVVGNQIFRL
jgi:hypothetical protein